MFLLASAAPIVNYANRIPIDNVAYAQVLEFNNSAHLYVSTFSGNPFKSNDNVYYFTKSDASILTTPPVAIPGGSLVWPNEVNEAPAEVFGQPGIVAAGGFLVPGKTNGGLWFSAIVDGKHMPWKTIYKASGYYYHRVKFFDVDADGKMDILSCRATTPLIGQSHGNLVWFSENNGRWVEHILGPHCDTFFDLVDLEGNGRLSIVSAEFWGSSLTIIRSIHPHNAFFNPKDLAFDVIDKEIGRLFDVKAVDVDNDGTLELIVTNHQGKNDKVKGALYIYQQTPSGWKRHLIHDDFPVIQKGIGQASPGSAVTFRPNAGKPWIAVAGDGSQKAYLFKPTNQDEGDFSYEMSVFHDCKSIVGGIGVGDIDGDGSTELFVPCYDKGYLAVYSY